MPLLLALATVIGVFGVVKLTSVKKGKSATTDISATPPKEGLHQLPAAILMHARHDFEPVVKTGQFAACDG